MEYRKICQEDCTPELQEAVNRLFGQLTSVKTPLELGQVLAEGSQTIVLGCWENGQLLGMASMAAYTVISGYKGWIEDVVVDQAHRGRKLGRELMDRLVALGREQGLNEIYLFTGHTRLPAIALYESMGFARKDSHLYVMKLG